MFIPPVKACSHSLAWRIFWRRSTRSIRITSAIAEPRVKWPELISVTRWCLVGCFGNWESRSEIDSVRNRKGSVTVLIDHEILRFAAVYENRYQNSSRRIDAHSAGTNQLNLR